MGINSREPPSRIDNPRDGILCILGDALYRLDRRSATGGGAGGVAAPDGSRERPERKSRESEGLMTFMRDEIFEQPDIVARLAADQAPYRAAAAERAPQACASCSTPPAARATTPPCSASTWPPSPPACRPAWPCPARPPSTARRSTCASASSRASVRAARRPTWPSTWRRRAPPGAFTIAVTNDEDSLLARRPTRVLATHAGRERAVAATKTYTSQLAVLALFWATWSDDADAARRAPRRGAEAMRAALALEERDRRDRRSGCVSASACW